MDEEVDTEEMVRKKCEDLVIDYDSLSEEQQQQIMEMSEELLQRVRVK